MSLGTPEIMIVVVLVLLLFGPDRLPGLLKSIGRGMREIKRVTSDFQNHFDFDDDTPPRPARPAPQNTLDNYETIPPYSDMETISEQSAPDSNGIIPTPAAQQPKLPLDQAHHDVIPQSEKEREA